MLVWLLPLQDISTHGRAVLVVYPESSQGDNTIGCLDQTWAQCVVECVDIFLGWQGTAALNQMWINCCLTTFAGQGLAAAGRILPEFELTSCFNHCTSSFERKEEAPKSVGPLDRRKGSSNASIMDGNPSPRNTHLHSSRASVTPVSDNVTT